MSPRHQNFDSNGPSIRIRGNAHQVYEKYLQLARDAHTAGDRIAAENMYQHAEHYFRLVNIEDSDNNQSRQNRGDGNDSRSSDRQYSGNDQQDNDDSSDSNDDSTQEAASPRPPHDSGRENGRGNGRADTPESDDDTKVARRPARRPRRTTARPVEASENGNNGNNGNDAGPSVEAVVIVEKPPVSFDNAAVGDDSIDERAAD